VSVIEVIPATMEQFAEDLQKAGDTVVRGERGTIWRANEGWSLMRFPVFDFAEPTPEELHRLFREGKKPLVTFQTPATEAIPANGYMFLYDSPEYDIEMLGAKPRRDARIALRRLRFEFADWDTILAHGFQAFHDTRTRNGLSDGTPQVFHRRFTQFRQNRAHYALAAFDEEDNLAGYLTLIVVGNIVAASGTFSANEHLRGRPSNGLVHTLLDYFITQRKFKVVSYGSSTIQEAEENDGLHTFKIRGGFDARPVVRRFEFNPYLKPLVNRATLWGMKQTLRLSPGNRMLRKAVGVIETALKV